MNINKYELNPEYVNQHYTLDEAKKALNLALEQGNEEAIAELCEKYPEEVKNLLKIRNF